MITSGTVRTIAGAGRAPHSTGANNRDTLTEEAAFETHDPTAELRQRPDGRDALRAIAPRLP